MKGHTVITNPDPNDLTPILIKVADGRWHAFGPVTLRSRYLYNNLVAQGGVSDSVADGMYHFNVLEVNGQEVATLTQAIP